MGGRMETSDFIGTEELSQLSTYTVNAIYAQYARKSGALFPILTKLGSRLGCWRADYEAFKRSQRRLPDTQGSVAA
jgi:hypothetical protein